jgi:hypothetical protein
MLKNIKKLEGVILLSKEQQRSINGGEKCETLSKKKELYINPDGPTYIGPGYPACTCTSRCRPSFLGIGFGNWGETVTGACFC